MMTNDRALELIEAAQRADLFCPCGEPTRVVAEGDAVRLECASRDIPGGVLHRLLKIRLDVRHVDRLILQDPIVALAA